MSQQYALSSYALTCALLNSLLHRLSWGSLLGEHKPGRIKPGRIKRAALSLQNQTYC